MRGYADVQVKKYKLHNIKNSCTYAHLHICTLDKCTK
jgi:hypothetical protein